MKTKFTTAVFLASLSGLACLPTGCGQPKVKVPERDRLVAPAPPQGTLSLTDARDDVSTYTGGLVIWDDTVQAEALSKLLTATRQYNTLQVKAERSLDNYLEQTFEPRKKAIAAKDAELVSLRKQDDASVDARQADIAAGWFNVEMTKIVNGPDFLPLGQGAQMALSEHSNKVFEAYCEAKIWKYGFNAILARQAFFRRPTPDALCENVYAAKGFFQGGACADADSPAGKNYFACVWTEGIARTSYYATVGADARARLAPTMSTDVARQFVSGERTGVATCGISTIETNVLTMAKGPTAPARNLKGLRCADITSTPIALKKVIVDASGLETDVTAWEATLASSTPAGMNAIFAEGNACPPGSDICVLPAGLDVEGNTVAVPPATLAALDSVRTRAAAFLQDLGGCDAALKSPNDAFFNANRLVDKTIKGCPKPNDLGTLPDTFAKPDPRISQLQAEIESLGNALYSDEAKMCPKNGLDDCNNGDSSLQCQLKRLTDEKFTAIFKPGVSKATFRDFTVRITRFFDVQKVTVSFGKNDAAEACVQVEGSPRVTSCGVVEDLAGAGLKADFEPRTGRLVLSLPIDLKVVLNGYLNKEGTFLVSTEQNEVGGLRAFAGKTLWMELFPSQLDGQRTYLSGKALVKDGTLDIAQGTASYLLDARFDKRLGTFCTQVRENAPGTLTASP